MQINLIFRYLDLGFIQVIMLIQIFLIIPQFEHICSQAFHIKET